MTVITTPCVQVCELDPQTDWCWGCGRARAEIAAWTAMSEAERLAVMDALPARLEALLSRLERERTRAP